MTSLIQQMPSTFLKKENFPQPVRVQIAQFKKQIVGEGAEAAEKMVVYFHGYEQGMVLNVTNANLLVQIFGDDMDAMIGQSVVVHNDPSIAFGGKLTGGIRFMIEQQAPPPLPTPIAQPVAQPVSHPTGAPATAPPAPESGDPGF